LTGKSRNCLSPGPIPTREITDLENIFMNGTLIGMTKDGIDRKKQTIIDFSEQEGVHP
jgi:ABC-type polysaccharide/polyol phosphate transport system ATPase subunit